VNNTNKYLQLYAEKEVKLLSDFPVTVNFNHVVVIPAYKEDSGFIERFITAPFIQNKVLMILVVNQPDNDNNSRPQQLLANNVRSKGNCIWSRDNLQLILLSTSDSAILLVDRFTEAINAKFGVGQARKIGVDLASALIENDRVKSQWIASTDADASLPDDYFSVLCSLKKNQVAGCFNFTHQSDDVVIHQANALYERAMRYYVAGLLFAQSPYAFFTIGSVLVFDKSAYVNVRGFPKKNAGEDFYLLNKLAKIGQVAFLNKTIVRLEARVSDRVPFGTGPSVSHIMSLAKENKAYLYYHPRVFYCLKATLSAFKHLYQHRYQIDQWYSSLSTEIIAVLRLLDFELFINKQRHVSEKQFSYQLVVWFDAFKTLKFIHHCRDLYFPNIDLAQAINIAEFDC
jgi:hypothetical protein